MEVVMVNVTMIATSAIAPFSRLEKYRLLPFAVILVGL
jgi:hypothetical protein